MHKSQLKLREITTSHFQVLNTWNANINMQIMIPIAYLHKNLMDCNEILEWCKQESLIHSYVFWYTTRVEKVTEKYP